MHFGGDEWSVDRVPGGLSVQNRQHLLRSLDGDFSLGFFGGRAQMRSHYNLRVTNQIGVLRRFLGENVQSHSAQLPRFQSVQDCLLVHQFATGHVDEPGSRLKQGNLGSADHVPGAISQRCVQCDEVSLGQQFFQ